jgi:hypothetical protein
VRRAEVVGVDYQELRVRRVAEPRGQGLHLELRLREPRAAEVREREQEHDARKLCLHEDSSGDSSPCLFNLSTTELMQ